MQTVYVLCDEREFGITGEGTLLKRSQREMARIGQTFRDAAPSFIVPAADKFRVIFESFGGAELRWIEIAPQTGERISKRGNSTFGGDARAGEHNDVPRIAEQLNQAVVIQSKTSFLTLARVTENGDATAGAS